MDNARKSTIRIQGEPLIPGAIVLGQLADRFCTPDEDRESKFGSVFSVSGPVVVAFVPFSRDRAPRSSHSIPIHFAYSHRHTPGRTWPVLPCTS